MKKKLCKYLLSLGILLFISVLLPFTPWNSSAAKAANMEVEKEGDYKLNLKALTLVKGKSYTLKVYNLSQNAKVIYKSDDVGVASVNEIGEVTANSVGTTKVTATVKEGATITNLICEVTVGLPAFSVKATKSRIIIGLDKTDFMNVVLKPSNTVEVAKYSSYDSSIASVSTGARITAKKIGLTYVFAEIEAVSDLGTRKFTRSVVIVTKAEDASLLESYFTEHTELNSISEDDLTKALDEFFNKQYDPTSTSSLINSLDRFLNDRFNLEKLRTDKAAVSA